MIYTGSYTYEQKREFVINEINDDGFLSKETLMGRIKCLKKTELNRMVREGVLCVLSNKTYDTPERRDKRLYSFRHDYLMWCETCNNFTFMTDYGDRCKVCKEKSKYRCIFPMKPHGSYA